MMYTVKMKVGQQILFSIIGIAGLVCYLYLMLGDEEWGMALNIGMLLLFLADIVFLFYCMRMRVKVYVDYFVYYPPLGRKRTMNWNEVGITEIVMTKYGEEIIIYDKNNRRVCHLGAGLQNVGDFISTVQTHRQTTWKR